MKQDERIVNEDMEALNLGNLNTVEFDLHLPTYGENGSHITWESSDTRYIKRTGRVIQPRDGRGKRVVTLTGTFQYGEVTKTKSYSITVLEANTSFEVSRIYPIVVEGRCNRVITLPGNAIVDTSDHEVLSHTIDWQGKEEVQYAQAGTYEVCGVLLHSPIEVKAQVHVSDTYEVERLRQTPILHTLDEETILSSGSSFYQAQEEMKAYLLSKDDDQMLYNFRYTCGLDVQGAQPMIGWDTLDSNLRGHTTGHYLSALAVGYRATKDERLLRKAEYMVHSLHLCQEAFAELPNFHPGYLGGFDETQFDLLEELTRYPKIWAPYYTLHKILAGLLDCFEILHIEEALTIAIGLGNWTYERLSQVAKPTLKKMWGIYIAGEYGGMNESLAKLYQITKDVRYLETAKMFDNDRLCVPMAQNVDALCGIHVNQHIPQILGELEIYKGNQEKKYFSIADNFWNLVVKHHIYTNGGIGEGEIFHAPDAIAAMIDDNTAETCATYNMLKLTRELYCYDADVKYMDYYERAMINHILASRYRCIPGANTYFLPLEPGSKKSYEDENSCCHGTGMENHFKYIEAIFFHREEDVYINLFLNAQLQWKEHARIDIDCDEQKPEDVCIQIHGSYQGNVYIRIPYWTNDVHIERNQKPVHVIQKYGYAVLSDIQKNEIIDLHFTCSLFLEATNDDASIISLHYGPYVLAALSDEQEYIRVHLEEETLQEQIQRCDETLTFYDTINHLTYRPLYQMQEDHYHVYMKKEKENEGNH